MLVAMQRQDRSILGWLALIVAVGALFVGLFSLRNDDSGSASGGGGSASGGVPTIEVVLTEFKFTPNNISIPNEGAVLKLVNNGSAAHTFDVPQLGLSSGDVAAGATKEMKIGKTASGVYDLICKVPGHADSGMTGTLAVGGTAAATNAAAQDAAHGDPNQILMNNEQMDKVMVEVAQKFPAKTEGIGGKILEPTSVKGNVKTYDLEAKIVDWEVAPGKVVKAWTYNGVVPGPEFNWEKGDHVVINFKNSLPQSTTIHWHGIRVPNLMDGVDPYTQQATKPGETFVYEFDVLEEGNGIYHSHHNAQEQIPNGMFGAIAIGQMPIPPKLAEMGYTKIDKKVTMVLNDAGVIGLSLNGKSFPATEAYTLRVGQVMEVTYQNEGLMGHPMHLHQPVGWIIAKDGKPLDVPTPGDTIWVSPGERYTVLYKAVDQGVWAWHCHILNHAEGPQGMFGMVTALIVER